MEGILDFVQALPEGLRTLWVAPDCLDAIRHDVARGPLPPTDQLTVTDLDGDGTPEFLVAVVPPVSIVRQTAGALAFEDLPSAAYWPPDNTWPSMEQAADLTGDGQPEGLVAYIHIGGSRTGTELLVLGREEGGWAEWLRAVLDNWAGGGEWWLEPQPDGSQAVVTTWAAFGFFDAKLVAHPVQRNTYRWDGRGFALAASEQDPPANRRQVVNVAESALRAGPYRAALETYRILLDEPDLLDEPPGGTARGKPDWVSYAALRVGQIHARLGERGAALTMLVQAAEAGSTVARLAERFCEAYEATSSPAVAWAAMLADTEIYAEQYEERGNLVSFPGNALDALYPRMALAAALNTRPDAADGDEALQMSRVGQRGAQVAATLAADLDGDGQEEVVAVQLLIPRVRGLEGGLAAAWVLDVAPDGWFAALLEAFGWNADVQLRGPIPVPDTTRLAVLVGDGVGGWDGEQVIHYRDAHTWWVETDPMRRPVRW